MMIEKKIKEETIYSLESIFDKDSVITTSLYIVSDEKKLGMVYDKRNWDFSNNEPEYSTLLECSWDHFDVFDTLEGVYVAAYSQGKCNCYYLKYSSTEKQDSICISASLISQRLYDKITYDLHKSPYVLLLRENDDVWYYDLKAKVLSERCDWCHPLSYKFILYSTKCQSIILNLENGDELSLPPPNNLSSHIERYEDGYVFIFYDNWTKEETQMVYLVFYSEREHCFYKTDIYDDVNIYVTTPSTLENRITGFDGIKEGKIISHVASKKFWTDEDIKRSRDISLYQ